MSVLNLTLPAPDPEFPLDTLLGLAPHLIWATLVVCLLRWIGRDEIRSAIGRLDKIGVAGVELQFRAEIGAAATRQGKAVSPQDARHASRRLVASKAIVTGARVLWVDDKPENNQIEAALLEDAGARITWSKTTTNAVKKAIGGAFDVVISDMKRGNDDQAGVTLARELAASEVAVDIIFYVGAAHRPPPAEAFGIADRPDELIHLVLDVLGRRRS